VAPDAFVRELLAWLHGTDECVRRYVDKLMRTIVLLTISNIFMTFAWYGHLKYRDVPLFRVIVISWMIAFFEYCFQVPANRIGSYEFSAAQLKTIQEVITLVVFSVFSVLYLKQPVRWNHAVGFAMIVAAVGVIFKQW
jgi:uncharacterized protein (DUF486 family)